MGWFEKWCRRFAAPTYTPPFPQPIASNVERYLAVTPLSKMVSRRARRWLWLAVNGQLGLERAKIAASDRRILWIHSGMPQVGDSLMDLACRELLRGSGRRIDLLIDPHLVPLYASDEVFTHAYGDPAEAAGNDYDLAVVLGASSHNLREKLGHFRRLPYVNLQGYYTGPEFQRTLFDYFRLAQLLGGGVDEAAIRASARPSMTVSDAARAAVAALGLPPRFVALAVGGVRGFRTYAHWPAVVAALRQAGVEETIVLLGAANGLAARDAILAGPGATAIVDRVDRHPLPEVFEILRRSTLAACADGGLLHVAHAAGTATVSLFAERIEPEYRLTQANRSHAFYAATEVSEIAPARVAAAIAGALREPIVGVSVTRV
ncbi:MAG: glycosyltransferase family 9 protein [Caldimonas sp.]